MKSEKISSIIGLATLVCGLALLTSCVSTTKETQRGTPTLLPESPEAVYVEASQTFDLDLSADSCEGAKVTFYLLDGETVVMQNETGHFTGIAPLEEGYNVYLSAEWEDTTIVTPTKHVFGFVIPREPVEPMTKEEFQALIKAKDSSIKRGDNEHLAQAVMVTTLESKYPVTTLLEAIEKLEQGLWTTVEVTKVEYDENNLITSVTLKPSEKVIKEEDYEDEEEYYE